MRRALTTIAVASALLALAGCAATPPAAVAPTPTAAHEDPTVPPVSDPAPRVPLVCDQLASAPTVQAVAGTVLAPVSPVAQSDPPTIAPLASLQYGQLDCAWSREPSLTYNQSPPLITISVVPEVPSSYWAETLTMSQGVTDGTFPGDSIVQCTASQCRLDILVNGYWMSATVALDTEVTLETATPLFSAAVEAVATAAAPGARWTAPTSGARAGGAGPVDQAAVAATLGATMDGVICGPTAQAQEHWVAQAESGYAHCVYSLTGLPGHETAYVDIEYLPGGAWGFDATAAIMNPAITALPQLGVEAFSAPSGPDTTSILFIRGGDLVLVSVYPFEGTEPSPATAASIAEAIAPALP